jgi:hypothetical protein
MLEATIANNARIVLETTIGGRTLLNTCEETVYLNRAGLWYNSSRLYKYITP